MKTLILLLAATALTASPAAAQHQGHSAPAPAAPQSTCTPEHAAMGHCELPQPDVVKPKADPHAGHAMPAAAPQSSCTPEHAAMGHCELPQPDVVKPETDPHAGHAMPATAPQSSCTPEHAAMGHCELPRPDAVKPEADPHAGHAMPQVDAHAGHDMSTTAAVPPIAPPPPAAFSGPEHAADLFYGDTAMTRSRTILAREHGDIFAWRVLLDRAEARLGEGHDSYAFDGDAWFGGDIDKLWLKYEGEGTFGGRFEEAEVQALWSHAIGPFFDLQAGVRYDARLGPDRGYLVLGAQGLAPYWIEVDGSVFLSDKGDVTARAEAEHDVRITQRLILQPRIEAGLSLQDVPALALGAGLTDAAIGARLRYQVTPLFAPYVGLEYERTFGATRRFLRDEGESAGGWRLLTGVRTWF